MRRLLIGSLLLTTLVAGAPVSDSEIVAKLVSDLLPLKLAVAASEPLKNGVYTREELQSLDTYSQNQAMKPFSTDLANFEIQRYVGRRKSWNGVVEMRPFIGPDQGYKLAWVLTGKDLSEGNLKPLVEALVAMLENAEACRDTHSRLEDSTGLRTSSEKAWHALEALGVADKDIRIVITALFRGAENTTLPPPHVTYQ